MRTALAAAVLGVACGGYVQEGQPAADPAAAAERQAAREERRGNQDERSGTREDDAPAPADPTPAPAPDPSPVVEDAPPPAPRGDGVRNVILLIGDGMGPQQMGLLELWARHGATSPGRPTAMSRFADAGTVGIALTEPAEGLVVDSACSATMLATGRPALSEVIGLDDVGDPVPTILEMAAERGLATGLVSDTRITHATPAAFAAHVAHRSMESEIAGQMLDAGVDVMLSGGARFFAAADSDDIGAPFDVRSRRDDERDLIAEAADAGYAVVYDRDALSAATAESGQILGLFADSGMMNGIDWHLTEDAANRTEPTLREMTVAALDVLDTDPDGFFLMVEGGQIDWAGHDNDAGRTLHEMRKFDDAVDAVLRWAEGRSDTLVVLTADHETGGFGFSYSAYDLPEPTTVLGSAFGGLDYQPNFNFGSHAQLDGLFAQTMSHADMMRAADGDAEDLMAIVNANSAFQITEAQAEEILTTKRNPYRADDHAYLDVERVGDIHDFDAFYPFGMSSAVGLLARALANQQNIVWSTGTHTHTPVSVFAIGPEAYAAPFGTMLHQTDIGQLLISAYGWD